MCWTKAELEEQIKELVETYNKQQTEIKRLREALEVIASLDGAMMATNESRLVVLEIYASMGQQAIAIAQKTLAESEGGDAG